LRWSVAVTAAPRDGAFYLADAVDSIIAAGWPDGIVYAEPGTPDCRWPMDYANEKIGSWPQFQRALRGCLESPCDAAVVFQDDCLVARNCRGWLDRELAGWRWPDAGLVCLYTCEVAAKAYAKGPGWFAVPDKTRRSASHGAVAVVVMREVAERLAAKFPRPLDRTKTDYHLELWCRDQGLRIVMHNPSLARHVGVVSAVRAGKKNKREPRLSRWRREGEFAEDCQHLPRG